MTAVEPVEAGADLLADLPTVRAGTEPVEVTGQFRCGTGETFAGRWRGVPLAELLAAAPPSTTHVRVLGADGYCVPIPVADALDAVVATDRIDGPPEGLPRLVAPDLDGFATVREIKRIEPVALPADADPVPEVIER